VVSNDVIAGAFTFLVVLLVVVGLPMLVTDWLRQRSSTRVQAKHLEAWQQAQEASQSAWAEDQQRGQAIHQAGLDQQRAANEQFLAASARALEVSKLALEESRVTNERLSRLIDVLESRSKH
jgi:hypothetical protein